MSALTFTPSGIYCPAGDFYIDPWRPVTRALITHGHADHARSGMGSYLATDIAAPVMRHRLGEDVFVTIPQPNLRARVQQAFGNGAANALGCTSDDGHFTVQFDLVHAKSPLFLRATLIVAR